MNITFEVFLKSRGMGLRTIASVSSRIRRIRDAYDLDDHFEVGHLAQMIEQLNYGANDERLGRPNPSRVAVRGNLRDGLASLKHAAVLYAEYHGVETGAEADGAAVVFASMVRSRRSTEPAPVSNTLDGVNILTVATAAMGLNLTELVARSSIWAHPEVVAELMRFSPHAAWFPRLRRMKNGESRGTIVRGERLDDNSYANQAIKLAAVGKRRVPNFHACHVWPKTCYDSRYHTSIANLLLLPAPLAGLSDHNDIVAATLRYRAFELFGWHPEDQLTPGRPDLYPAPDTWREIPGPNDRILRVVRERISRMGDGPPYPFASI